jgi:hypothetical protein
MINFNLNIDNPWSDRWNTVWYTSGLLPKHKAWELNGYRTNLMINAELRLTVKGDHAGLHMMFGLFGYSVEFSIYDTRHWDWENDTWIS